MLLDVPLLNLIGLKSRAEPGTRSVSGLVVQQGKIKKMKNVCQVRLAAVILIVLSGSLGGCASIVNGTNQVMSVEARNKGEAVAGASCKLESDKGTFFVTAPGTVTVHRGYHDLAVKCEKDNLPPGLATVKSSTKGMLAGNILFGGIIGVAVDAGTGAAYDYPSLITIMMGEDIRLPAVTPPVVVA